MKKPSIHSTSMCVQVDVSVSVECAMWNALGNSDEYPLIGVVGQGNVQLVLGLECVHISNNSITKQFL
jgi:hypothetical protein